jgi:outer membrane protein TolC
LPTAETTWIGAIRSYKQNLDLFKILLGLPTDARIILDDKELEGLRIVHPAILPEEAVQVALVTRLDLATSRDRKVDAERQVDVAADGLKPMLNLVVSGNIDNKPGSNNPLDLDLERARGSMGLNLELPIDRKAARNRCRAALIQKTGRPPASTPGRHDQTAGI